MNMLIATIQGIESSLHLSSIDVTVDGDSFCLLLAEIHKDNNRIGEKVTLAFKETEVILTKTMEATTANIQSAKIVSIDTGVVMTQVRLNYNTHMIDALVSTVMFKQLETAIGDTIYWIINPSEISLVRSHDGI